MKPKACPDDDELLPATTGEQADPDVQSHVEGCSTCRERLRRMQAEVASLRKTVEDLGLGAFDEELDKSHSDDDFPAAIGPYRVVLPIGEGGQADVYRAIHPALSRDVVIKLSRKPAFGDPDFHERFLAEGKVLAALDHAHLARVYDLDFYEGRPFLVMEYVRGVTLLERVRQAPPRPEEAARWVAQAARALAAAHARAVVHLDLKPENIILDEDERPRIIDFGMARLRDAWTLGPERRTIGGTIEYMPPEQARGEIDRLGPRTDIFALGAVLYFLLAGRPPYQDSEDGSALDKAERCQFDRAPLESPRVPRRLARICLRAMAPQPGDRYASAEDLAADLERSCQKPPYIAGVLALAAALLVAGVGWAFWQRVPDPPAVQILVRSLQRGEPVYTPQSTDELVELLPLKTGDKLVLESTLPHDHLAAAFVVGTSGDVQELPSRSRPAAPYLVLQAPDTQAWRLDPGAGTVLLLVCASASRRPTEQEVQSLFDELGASARAWPQLPPAGLLLNKRDIEPFGDLPRDLVETPYTQVWDHLEQLQGKLRERYDYFWGVALPQEQPSGSQ